MSSIPGNRSILSSVFRFKLSEISSSSVLRDLLHSFKVETPVRSVGPPSLDWDFVLCFLTSAAFEPLALASLHNLTKKVLFLDSLATATRVGELQAVSCYVSFVASDACLSYVPEFLAKTGSSSNPLPRSFLVKSLSDFAAGLELDLFLCPVRTLRIYLHRASSVANHPRHIFVSLVLPLVLCLRMVFLIFCGRSFMKLGLVGR